MRVAIIVAAFILPLVAGCSAPRQPTRDADLDKLVGQPEDLVRRVLGAPDEFDASGGQRVLTYITHKPDTFAGYDMFDGYGRYGRLGYRRLGFEAKPELYEKQCQTTIVIDAGRMTGYRLWGNDCG